MICAQEQDHEAPDHRWLGPLILACIVCWLAVAGLVAIFAKLAGWCA